MYKRSTFITTVNRIGRNPTLLSVATQTRIDRESYIHKANSGDLRQRIAAAASSAVDVTFDLVAFKDLTLAGFGPSATFHFAGSGLKTPPASPLLPPNVSVLRSAALAPLSLEPAAPSAPQGTSTPHLGNVRYMLWPDLAPWKQSSVAGVVNASWAFVRGDADAIGLRAFAKLFSRDPALLDLFGFHQDPAYLTSRGMRMHASAIMRTIGMVPPPPYSMPSPPSHCGLYLTTRPSHSCLKYRRYLTACQILNVTCSGLFEILSWAYRRETTNDRALSPPLLRPSPPSSQVIESLDDLDAVTPMLARLGRTHTAVGVKPEFFAAMRECLIEELAASLGAANFTDEVEAAWRCIVDAIVAVIISVQSEQQSAVQAACTK